MGFNVKKYTEAMDKFQMKIKDVPSEKHPDMKEAVRDICVVLKIGKLTVSLYENSEREKENSCDTLEFYNGGSFDERNISLRQITGQGTIAVYKAFQITGNKDWTTEEQKKINIFLNVLHMHLGRIRVMNIADRLTYRDMQFGIYNLNYFMRYVTTQAEKNTLSQYAASFFNLKHFSMINNQVGRERGSNIMLAYINGLNSLLSDEEIVCRVGGDNYVTLFYKKNLQKVQEYLAGQKIVYNSGRDVVYVSASAGFYVIEDSCKLNVQVMDRISIACNIARNVAKVPAVFYDNDLRLKVEERKHIEGIFANGLQNEEFQVYYQPKINLIDNTVAGAEALCRWKHGDEILMPGSFIPLLEQNGEVRKLDFYMLEHVCMNIKKWINQGRAIKKISVNFSSTQFGDVYLAENIAKVADKYNVPHEYIEIEFAEAAAIADYRDIEHIIRSIREKGFDVVADGFGEGVSSLNLLRKMPWTGLKLSRHFFDTPVAKHIMAIAKEIGISCQALGVENKEQIEFLKENNCCIAQGFLFEKPVPVEEFEKILTRGIDLIEK